MKGFRASFHLTLSAEDLAAATRKWDDLEACACDLGFNLEGGAVGEMKPEEIIPGSPLAAEIARAA